MNANELIDDLYDIDTQASQQSLNDWAEEAVTMLRKQQESIEGLNRDYDLLFAEHQLLLKKEWVGLTDEEHMILYTEADSGLHDWARAIEAKLKQKNKRGQE